jgi:hypothetical protein
LLCVFALLLCIGAFYHEPWRDELHALSISQSATSLSNLYALRGYEGHPILYFAILYATQVFGKSLLLFVLVHILASVTSMYLLLFKMEVPNYIKILLIGNYYFLFEFGIINRSYIFVLLAILAAIFFYKSNKIWLSFVVILTGMHLHIQAMPLFTGIFGFFLLQLFRSKKLKLHAGIMASIMFMLSAYLCYISCGMHYPDAEISKVLLIPNFANTYKEVITKVNIGNLTIFNFLSTHFWNKFIFWHWPLHAILFFVFIASTLIFMPKPQRIIYGLNAILCIYFLFVIQGWGYRHFAFVWFAYFIFYLVSSKTKQQNLILTLWLLPQTFSGLSAYCIDIAKPFSNSKPTAAFLKTLNTQTPIAGCQAYTIDGICNYLQKPMYYLGNNEVNTFIRWTNKHYINKDSGAIQFKTAMYTYLKKYPDGYVVLSEGENFVFFEQQLLDTNNFKTTKIYCSPNESIVENESFAVYGVGIKK